MANPIFELSINLIETYLILWFLTRYFGSRFKDFRCWAGFFTFWLLYFLELSFINYILPFEGLLGFIPIGIYFLYALCCLKGTWGQKLLISVFTQAIVAMVAIIMSFLVSLISSMTISSIITDFSFDRIFMVVSGRLVLFYLFCIILQLKSDASLHLRGWVLFIGLPILTLVSMIFLMQIALIASETAFYVFMASIVIVITNMLTLYFMNRIAAKQEKEREYDLMKQQQDSVKQSEEYLMTLYENTNGLRHDLNEHMLAVQTMLKKGENDRALSYLQGCMEKIVPQQEFVLTSNYLLNALINVKLELCASKNIVTSVAIEDTSLSFMQTEDIVTLLGNLFNNAIEAAEKTDEKYILFTMQRQNEYLSIYMENSVWSWVLKENQTLITTKADKKAHGFGVKNIYTVINKYEGMIEFFDKPDLHRFCCDILLHAPEQQENNTNCA